MDDNFDKVNVSTWLPFGEQLRVLLSSEHVSVGEIAALARSKGFFAASPERSQLIQFLSTTLIQPVEFEKLIDSAVSRESRPKQQPQNVTLIAGDVEWQQKIEELASDLASVVSLDKIPGVAFASEPSIRKLDRNHLVVSYEISRQDYSKDLLHRELSFKAEVSIRQENGALTLDVISQHTARETDKINDQIIGHITRGLKASGISAEDAPVKIRFGSFTNKDRVTFLLRLAGPQTVGDVPGQIVDLNIKPNDNRTEAELVPELKLFEGSIRNMRMDGDKLNEILLLADETFHGAFFLTRVLVDYEFKLDTIRGKCTVLYYFQIARGIDDLAGAPFSFGVESVSVDGQRKSVQLPAARKAVNAAVLASVDKHFKSLRLL